MLSLPEHHRKLIITISKRLSSEDEARLDSFRAGAYSDIIIDTDRALGADIEFHSPRIKVRALRPTTRQFGRGGGA